MVIDAHTHIFPPEMISGRERFFSGEPEFRLLYGPRSSKMASAADLIESMDANGIDYSVVFGFPWRSEKNLVRHNDYVVESAAMYPDRLIPFACLDLFSPNCIYEAQRRRSRDGVAGFGELAIYAASDNLSVAMENFKQLADLCTDSGAILLAHANEPIGHNYPGKAPFGLDLYYTMAKAASGTNLILAHWGGGTLFYELLKKDAPETLQGVFYDTAASPYLYQKEIYRVAVQIAENKILFGSDYPLISPRRYFEEMKESGLTEKQITAISGGNAANLFGLKN